VGIGNAETEDTEEERDAPVSETYGSKSPITKDIRGTQTYTIGTGTDGPTEASVSISFDENAAVTISGKSAVSISLDVDSDLSITSKSAKTEHYDKKVTLTTDADVEQDIKGKYSQKNTAYDIYTLFNDLIDEIEAIQTFGPPPRHQLQPDTVTKFEALRQKINSLYKE
jgi:hypothetical protein